MAKDDQNERMSQNSSRPFGSRFKQKVSKDGIVSSMDYSNSKDKTKIQSPYLKM